MTVDLIQASDDIDAVQLRAPWLVGFAFRCRKNGRTIRTIRSGDLLAVHVVTSQRYETLRDPDSWRLQAGAVADSISFLSGPYTAGRGAEALIYLIALTDGGHLALRIATSPGTFEDIAAKLFRSHVTNCQQRALRGKGQG